jgi:hypothetical protein
MSRANPRKSPMPQALLKAIKGICDLYIRLSGTEV